MYLLFCVFTAVMNALKDLSKSTNILSDPKVLPEQVTEAALNLRKQPPNS